ncbi:MAG TPA: SAM-dependent methyltransferase [Thermoanaerobaculia bacterium]|nr:SAM-dependent methyltransferase [Thermoanaerobaculia bacterium]
MSSLRERLVERITREGPISFRDFMETALYDPRDGYYARGAAIGDAGDFVTSPTISPVFAAAIAQEFRRGTESQRGPIDFVDVGAGDGRFLSDLAAALKKQDPELAARVRLTAVERSARARERLRRRELPGTLCVCESVEEVPRASIRGWIFSNEFFDALPVVRVEGAADGPRELRVGLENGRFVWVAAPAPEAVAKHLSAFGISLEPGQQGEVALDAAPTYRTLCRALASGSIVTFDYGHRAEILYHPLARRRGTLAVHSAGRRGGDPLSRPGEIDLTAHVNWDDLRGVGEAEGLRTRGVFRQGRFLLEAGLLDLVESDAEKWRAYRLIDPEGMGEELSVLIQTRAPAPL